MTNSQSSSEELLVAVDFSPGSQRAFDAALRWRSATAELTLLHVVERGIGEYIEQLGLGTADDAMTRMRTRAEGELAQLIADRHADRVETMVVIGEPFVEIVRIANDLDCDLIVMGVRSSEGGIKQLLFGGTAEKVLRAANRPVLCVP